MAGFVQIIEFKTSRIKEIEELGGSSRTEGSIPPTFRRIGNTADGHHRRTYFTLVEFDSFDPAMENSGRLETSDVAANMAAQCGGPLIFQNLDVMWEDTGEGADTARSRTWIR